MNSDGGNVRYFRRLQGAALMFRRRVQATVRSAVQQPQRTVVARAPQVRAPAAAPTGGWVPRGVAVTVAGRQIPGGMIYVGTGVASAAGHGIEPALIDPRLRVDWARPDWQGLGFSYWPSYDRIPEQARAAYLSWLAGTRDQPVQIGYVFLYFYGLERRALTDLGISATDPELELIVAEVNRLLAIYGPASSSFDGYASSFLNLLSAVKAVHEPISPPDHHAAKRSWEIPLTVRIGLGRFVAAGRPIPASWALSLVRTHPEAYLRTPAKRCPDEFDALFKLRYCAKYGDGMVVAAPKATVSVTYRPASAGFRGRSITVSRRSRISPGSLGRSTSCVRSQACARTSSTPTADSWAVTRSRRVPLGQWGSFPPTWSQAARAPPSARSGTGSKNTSPRDQAWCRSTTSWSCGRRGMPPNW